MSDYLLALELGPQKDDLEICADAKGLEFLVKELSSLPERTKPGEVDDTSARVGSESI